MNFQNETKMKDVIDVMQLQREKTKQLPVIDYTESENNFIAVRFIYECGVKLDAQPLTIATATILYHRFFKEAESSSYDSYLIAATTLYLAGKVKDDPLKIRDVINVTHNTLHRGSAPLELGDEYWSMRDAIVQAELLIMRMLKFEVTIIHPHKYMLHYLKSLEGWFTKEDWEKTPLVKASFAFLQDYHFDPSILDYKPQHTAVACINLALQCYGMEVPFTEEGDGVNWYSTKVHYEIHTAVLAGQLPTFEGKEVNICIMVTAVKKIFTEDLTKDKLWEIMEKIMEVYSNEPETK